MAIELTDVEVAALKFVLTRSENMARICGVETVGGTRVETPVAAFIATQHGILRNLLARSGGEGEGDA